VRPARGGEVRALFRDLCLLEMVRGIFGVYEARVRDPRGRRLLETYLGGEEDRGRRIRRHLEGRGCAPPGGLPRLFAAFGRLYGRATSLLGSRVMLRIALSSAERAARRACASLGAAPEPDLQYLTTLHVRHEADLVDGLRQHLIDTRRCSRRQPG
jgi:hypothetical protein